MSTQGAFEFFSQKKKTNKDDGADTSAAANANKRGNNKKDPKGLIGWPVTEEKGVVIFSKKSVEESANDISTQSKKITMKDLLAVLKDDSRLAHKPLVYQLQNKAQWKY